MPESGKDEVISGVESNAVVDKVDVVEGKGPIEGEAESTKQDSPAEIQNNADEDSGNKEAEKAEETKTPSVAESSEVKNASEDIIKDDVSSSTTTDKGETTAVSGESAPSAEASEAKVEETSEAKVEETSEAKDKVTSEEITKDSATATKDNVDAPSAITSTANCIVSLPAETSSEKVEGQDVAEANSESVAETSKIETAESNGEKPSSSPEEKIESSEVTNSEKKSDDVTMEATSTNSEEAGDKQGASENQGDEASTKPASSEVEPVKEPEVVGPSKSDEASMEVDSTKQEPEEAKAETKTKESTESVPCSTTKEEISTNETSGKISEENNEVCSEVPVKEEVNADQKITEKAETPVAEDKEKPKAGDDEKMEVDESFTNEEKLSEVKEKEESKTAKISNTENPAEKKDEVEKTVKEGDVKIVSILDLVADGKRQMAEKDFTAAADTFGQACEKGRELYGEMGDECADIFYLYGQSMLECGKLENGVLGGKVGGGPDEAEEDEEEGDDEDEAMEEDGAEQSAEPGKEKEEAVPNKPEEAKVNGDKAESEKKEEGQETETKPEEKASEDKINEPSKSSANEGTDESDEKKTEEDTPLGVAWEMFELAKVIYLRMDNKERAAETYMKLGEVGVESGHITAVEDMKAALELRKKIYPEGHRIIAETHFHIGLGFSFFQMFDEAVEQFDLSKQLLLKKIAELEKLNTKEAADETGEIKELIPDLDEKIADMVESKKEKLKREENAEVNGEGKGEGSSSDKNVSNISHLIKRKRKLDEVTSDLPVQSTKQVCLEEEDKVKEEDKVETKEEVAVGSQ